MEFVCPSLCIRRKYPVVVVVGEYGLWGWQDLGLSLDSPHKSNGTSLRGLVYMNLITKWVLCDKSPIRTKLKTSVCFPLFNLSLSHPCSFDFQFLGGVEQESPLLQ